jgi:two-component system chemotaxis response regulator CheB
MKSEAHLPRNVEAVVIGGSSGAVDALLQILPALPSSYAIPVIVVLHLLPTRRSGLAELLAAQSKLRVKEAEDKEPVEKKTVYLASPDYHLLVEKRRSFSLSADAPEHFSRPAIDVLFETAADAYGPNLVGVLLTGANEDGARGLARIRRMGGMTIVQSPETAVSTTMPESALRLGCVDRVLSLTAIGELLAQLEPAAPQVVNA